MTIEGLIQHIDDSAWADVLSVNFSDETLTLLISVTADDSRKTFEINCKSVGAFRISDHYTEWIEIENDSAEVHAYASAATTYIIWGDSVDWPKVIGRITQELAGIPELMTSEYIRETKKYTDYRLPLTVPASFDSAFQSLLTELGISAYVHDKREGKDKTKILRFGQRSYILAEEYEVVEVAV